MKYFFSFAVLTVLVLLQGTLLPVIFPWLVLNPALVFLIILSFRFKRSYLLGAALWSGLVQDILMGEVLGLFMLTNFVAMVFVWELSDSLLDNRVLTGGLRVVVATLIQEALLTFVWYIRLNPENLMRFFQLNAGKNLLSNLMLYILLLLWLRSRGRDKIEAAMEAME